MPYQTLTLHPDAPPYTRTFINHALEDHYFRDVHAMLRLPLRSAKITGGCNFSAFHTLLAAIGGISTVLYKQTATRIGAAFENVLVDYYPWDREEPELKSEDGRHVVAKVLYDEFRGPLTHNLGVRMVPGPSGQVVPVIRGYILKIIRLTDPSGDGLPEGQIELLETSRNSPFTGMDVTVGLYEHKKVLNLERLYWGIRQMVERLSADKATMSRAKAFLTQRKIKRR